MADFRGSSVFVTSGSSFDSACWANFFAFARAIAAETADFLSLVAVCSISLSSEFDTSFCFSSLYKRAFSFRSALCLATSVLSGKASAFSFCCFLALARAIAADTADCSGLSLFTFAIACAILFCSAVVLGLAGFLCRFSRSSFSRSSL